MKDGWAAAARRPPRAERLGAGKPCSDAKEADVQYLGIDWGTRRAAWCALDERGQVIGEGFIPADEDGLGRLVITLGSKVRGCVEMMSGAVWVRDRLQAAGWQIDIANARKVKAVAPLACKTDRVDARVLAELARRDLVPALWVPSLDERALRELLRRRMHLVRRAPRPRTAPSGCSPSGDCAPASPACASPARLSAWPSRACRPPGAIRSACCSR